MKLRGVPMWKRIQPPSFVGQVPMIGQPDWKGCTRLRTFCPAGLSCSPNRERGAVQRVQRQMHKVARPWAEMLSAIRDADPNGLAQVHLWSKLEKRAQRNTEKPQNMPTSEAYVKHMSSFLQDYRIIQDFWITEACPCRRLNVFRFSILDWAPPWSALRIDAHKVSQDHTRHPDSMHRDIVFVKLSSHLWHCFNSVLRLWDIHHQRQLSSGSLRRRDAMSCKPYRGMPMTCTAQKVPWLSPDNKILRTFARTEALLSLREERAKEASGSKGVRWEFKPCVSVMNGLLIGACRDIGVRQILKQKMLKSPLSLGFLSALTMSRVCARSMQMVRLRSKTLGWSQSRCHLEQCESKQGMEGVTCKLEQTWDFVRALVTQKRRNDLWPFDAFQPRHCGMGGAFAVMQRIHRLPIQTLRQEKAKDTNPPQRSRQRWEKNIEMWAPKWIR